MLDALIEEAITNIKVQKENSDEDKDKLILDSENMEVIMIQAVYNSLGASLSVDSREHFDNYVKEICSLMGVDDSEDNLASITHILIKKPIFLSHNLPNLYTTIVKGLNTLTVVCFVYSQTPCYYKNLYFYKFFFYCTVKLCMNLPLFNVFNLYITKL